MSNDIILEDGGKLKTESGGDVLQEGFLASNDGEFSEGFCISLKQLIKMINGDWQLNTVSGKEIKRFKSKPTTEQIRETMIRFKRARGY